MSVTITMPQLGETVTEGTILEWVKEIGETVSADEIIVEISTDKVDTEVPSPASGVLSEILVPAGETVEVGTPLAVLSEGYEGGAEAGPDTAEDAEAVVEVEVAETAPAPVAPAPAAPVPPAPTPAAAAPAPAPTAPVTTGDTSRRGVVSPVVRKIAAERGIDLAMVPGTGEGGRITRKDVETFTPAAAAAAPAPAASAPAPAAPAPASVAPPMPTTASAGASAEVREIPRLRQRIATNMRAAKDTAAHVWTSVEVDFDNVDRVRRAHRASFKAAEGFSLTYLPFIARATMDALNAYPVVNSQFDLDGGTWTFNRGVNLGIAVDLNQDGLVVVNIPGADGMTLKGIARSIRSLALSARENRVGPDDLTGFTFSITNPGPFGSFMSAPIIPVPNAAILSTDTVTKKPVVVEQPDGSDAIAIRPIGYLGLSWDHRVFDGSTAVLFLDRIKQNLQTWDWEQELS